MIHLSTARSVKNGRASAHKRNITPTLREAEGQAVIHRLVVKTLKRGKNMNVPKVLVLMFDYEIDTDDLGVWQTLTAQGLAPANNLLRVKDSFRIE